MLKQIYRSIVAARAGSAAANEVGNMTDAQLADIGVSRSHYPLEAMKEIEADFARKDLEGQAKRSLKIITKANLVVAV